MSSSERAPNNGSNTGSSRGAVVVAPRVIERASRLIAGIHRPASLLGVFSDTQESRLLASSREASAKTTSSLGKQLPSSAGGNRPGIGSTLKNTVLGSAVILPLLIVIVLLMEAGSR